MTRPTVPVRVTRSDDVAAAIMDAIRRHGDTARSRPGREEDQQLQTAISAALVAFHDDITTDAENTAEGIVDDTKTELARGGGPSW